MSDTYPKHDLRRQEFLAYLRGLGAGNECVTIPWVRPVDDYTRLMISGRRVYAHRWVYEEIIGPIPDEFDACHSCDNPPCVRPSHLWAGTPSENALDAFLKGRRKPGPGMRGEGHGMAKVSREDVDKIRAMGREGVRQRAIGKVFGISQAQVSKIVRGDAWS